MTAMYDDLGQQGDVAAASLIVEAHRRCRDCAAKTCVIGERAAEVLAVHRRDRAASAGR